MQSTENYDNNSVHIPQNLFRELMDSVVDTYEENDIASYHQFCRGMITSESSCSSTKYMHVQLTDDALVYLLNIALPENMEMWYGWNDEVGQDLITEAKFVLSAFNVPSPY